MDRERNQDHPPAPKRWECGDPYQYPIPEVGDHWENLLEPLLESDKAQCDVWKEEVQNLLIFAGLFSAVLTAFVIESYPMLQPDPNDRMIFLLERIATRLDNGTTSQPMDPVISSSSPNASSMRINIFWFIGLVFSLTTVLVRIVSLQWLREHQRYPNSLSSRERFALFNMRVEGIEAWYVPQIFSALPVLLQLALVLFLVGLVDFLLPAGKEVAIPVIIAIVIPLAFLIFTTMLPTFQTFAFLLPLWGRKLKAPQQCPYKSPQSRAFRQVIDNLKRVIQTFYNGLIKALLLLLFLLGYLLPLPLRLAESFKELRYLLLPQIGIESEMSVFRAFSADSWLSFDAYWLSMRNAYALSAYYQDRWISKANFYQSTDIGSLYDLTRGLIKFRLISGIFDSTVVFSKYHSVHELTSLVEKYELPFNSFNTSGRHSQYLNTLLSSKFDPSTSFTTFSAVLEDPPHAMIRDENAILILCNFPTFSLPRFIAQHFAELHIRLANSVYPKIPRTLESTSLEIVDYPTKYLRSAYLMEQLFSKTRLVFDPAISTQLSLVTESFFKTVTDPSIDDGAFFKSAHVRDLGGLIEFAVIGQSKNTVQPTLEFLSAHLNAYMDGQLGKRSDFLFYASSFYVRSLVDPFYRIYSEDRDFPAVKAFIPTLQRYLLERGTPDLDFKERFGVDVPGDSDRSNWWWPTVEEDQINRVGEVVISSDSPNHDIPSSHLDSKLERVMKSIEEQLPSQTSAFEENVVVDTSRDAGNLV